METNQLQHEHNCNALPMSVAHIDAVFVLRTLLVLSGTVAVTSLSLSVLTAGYANSGRPCIRSHRISCGVFLWLGPVFGPCGPGGFTMCGGTNGRFGFGRFGPWTTGIVLCGTHGGGGAVTCGPGGFTMCGNLCGILNGRPTSGSVFRAPRLSVGYAKTQGRARRQKMIFLDSMVEKYDVMAEL